MTSALACVGLEVSDETGLDWLVTSAHRAVREIGVFNGVHVGRWQDGSGAALILGWRSGELLDFIPAYTAARGGLLSDCHLINESVAAAAVVDAGGRQLTAMAFEAEQYRQLQALGDPVGRAGPDHRPGRRRPGPPRRGRLRRLPRQPARPGGRPRSGTPAALPRAGLVLAAPAGGRIVHLLRRLRRPRPGRAPRPPVRHCPGSRAARLRADRAAVHRRRRPHRRVRGRPVPGRQRASRPASARQHHQRHRRPVRRHRRPPLARLRA